MKFLKYIFWCGLFIFITVLFLPKENFYFLMEHKLNEYKIVLGNETLSEFLGVFSVKNAHVSYFGDEAAQIGGIKAAPFILYNEVEFENIQIAKKFQSFAPGAIESAKVKFTPFYPIKLWLNLNGEFGKISGSYNMYGKKIYLVLKPHENFKQKYPSIYREFKEIDGELVYESSF
ncbi:MAG: hypothetical protein LBB59_04005 [Campylobacteraceae bacterium]|jgi:hypothetical protein|nr:hypothetical protein [Campylobacteraceae bacterium]